MREHLYRGKDKDTGEWVHGDLVHDIPGNPMIEVRSGKYDGDDRGVIPETIGEYTGLLDRNGVKIFTGDIVWGINPGNPDDISSPMEVCWLDERQLPGLCYGMKRKLREPESGYSYYSIGCTPGVIYEVIGNIHDNSELLHAN